MIALMICPKKDCRNKTCSHKQVHEQNDFCNEACCSPFKDEVFALGCIPYDNVQHTERTPDNTKVPLPA